jgi:hypothetical protein
MVKNFFLKNKYSILFTCSTFSLIIPLITSASVDSYTTLAPITNYIGTTVPINAGTGLSDYLNNIYILGISLCTGLAVIMIVIGGIEYMGGGSWGKKEEGKDRIQAAVLGLLVALGSYVILNTLDTRFLNTNLNVEQVKTTGTTAGDSLAQTVVSTTIQTPLTEAEQQKASQSSNSSSKNSTNSQTSTNKTGAVTIQDQTTKQERLYGFATEITKQGISGRLGDSSTYNSDGSVSSSNTQYALNNTTPTTKEVQGVITAATNNGFTATYNTASKTEYQNLINSGVSTENVTYTSVEKNVKQVIGFTLTDSSAPSKTTRNFFTLPATVPTSGTR